MQVFLQNTDKMAEKYAGACVCQKKVVLLHGFCVYSFVNSITRYEFFRSNYETFRQ